MTRSSTAWSALLLLALPGAAAAEPADETPASATPGRMVTISFELDGDGAVRDCTVTVPSGVPELDEMSCRLVREQGRYEPVRDDDGKAIPATIIHTLNFSPADGHQVAARETDQPARP